jgi:signal recognition particle receptor subunit beta
VQPAKKILLADTPGHPKLRHAAIETLQAPKPSNLTGLIFVVDASAIGAESASGGELTETATYIHDTLLRLQQQQSQSKSRAKDVQFLIAANKMDLFTSLPEKLVKSKLQAEISKVRETKSKGIASVAQSTKAEGLNFTSADEYEDEEELLGGDGSVAFTFETLRDYGIDVSVLGGSVVDGDQGVEKWWEWIANLI